MNITKWFGGHASPTGNAANTLSPTPAGPAPLCAVGTAIAYAIPDTFGISEAAMENPSTNTAVNSTPSGRYRKTAAARAHIHQRRLLLSRAASDLLFLIDASRPVAEWLAVVREASMADVEELLAQGLIADEAAESHPVKTPEQVIYAELLEAMDQLTSDQMYRLLLDQAREQFGLVKGFQFVLDVEKCAGRAELLEMGHRLLSEVFVSDEALLHGHPQRIFDAISQKLRSEPKRRRLSLAMTGLPHVP
jgi:hypothetical protein